MRSANTFLPLAVPSGLPPALAAGLAQRRLPALDGLRAIAAFLVVFYHLGVPGIPGGLGVLIFFVLSGFLITWLLLKEEEKHGSISLRLFYIRRSLRIFPAFYAYWVLLIGALWIFHKPVVWGQAVSSLLYVTNYYQAIFGDPNTGLSHTWSLGIEEQFYLLWPAIFLLLRRRSRFLLGAILAIWLYRELLVLVFHVDQGWIYEAFDTRADHLLIGCFTAVSLREGTFPALWRWLCRAPYMPLITAVLLAGSILPYIWIGGRYRDTAGFIVEPVLVAALIVQLIAFRTGLLSRFLELPWMRYLGSISYSTYLYQQLLIWPVMKRLASWPLLAPLASIAAVVIAASCSYFFVEKPFLRLKEKIGRE